MGNYNAEILDTEKAFAQLVKEKGLKTGFLARCKRRAGEHHLR